MDNKDLVYRKLCPDDMDLFVRLRLDFINEFHKDVDETEKDKLKTSLQSYFDRHIKNDEFIGIVCEYDKKTISVAYLIIDEWPPNRKFLNGKIGTLLNVYTYPEYRKNGISTNIIKMILRK